jgi:hypothetical protein
MWLSTEKGSKRKETRTSGHDEARGVGVDGHVSSHQAHVPELLLQVAVLLVTQRLDGGRVDHALAVLQRLGDRVLGNGGLAGRGVRGHQHRLSFLDVVHSLLLECIQLEGVYLGGLRNGRR